MKFEKRFMAVILVLSMLAASFRLSEIPCWIVSAATGESNESIYKNFDDKSNIGAEKQVVIKGGTSSNMIVRDNGSMRKELSALDLSNGYMGIGINLGNTMEAQLPSLVQKAAATEAIQFETAWGAAPTTQEYIDCVHSYGINALRIPVAWSNMVNEETFEINEKYLGRVEEIVNYALNDGMYAIINIHWDNQWWGQFGAAKRTSETDATRIADEEKRAKAWARFESYWKQISKRFRDYSDHLIFEGGDEELGNGLNDPIYASGYSNPLDESDNDPIKGILTKDELYDTVNRINQKFVDVVRASGGNNAYRFLMIPGYDANINNTVDARFKMPTDTTENGKSKLFVSVHCYSPWKFCGDNQTGTYTDADKTALATELGKMQRFVDEGYAAILGECGICNPAGVDGDVPQWFRDCFAEAGKLHMVPVMWETGQYFNRSEAKLKFKDIAEMLNAMTGSKGDASMTRLTGKKNAILTLETVKIPNNLNFVWSWTGKWYKNGGDSIVGDDKFIEGGGTQVPSTEKNPRSKFVPSSQTTSAIDGDATEIFFGAWGYQTFLKVDLSKYRKPAIAFDFLEGTNNEKNVGDLEIGATTEADKHATDFSVDYWSLNGKMVILSDNIGLSSEKPWLCITFNSQPIVTAIRIYEAIDIESPTPSPTAELKETPSPRLTASPTPVPSPTPTPTSKFTASPTASPYSASKPTMQPSEKPSSIPSVVRNRQFITAKSYVKAYGSKAFYINARTNGDGQLFYGGANKKVAVVSQNGKVTIKGYGKTTVKITASGTDRYQSAVKKITITVIPKKAVISSLSSKRRGQIVCKVKKQRKVTGYEFVVIASNGDQQAAKQKKPVFKPRYKSKKKYKIKVRAYKKVGGKTYRGAWSKRKTIKTK